jgi:hypothetical protein
MLLESTMEIRALPYIEGSIPCEENIEPILL